MPRRHDLLAHWVDRGMINPVQFTAGRRFEVLYGRADMDGHVAIDLCRPKVDGKRTPHAVADDVVFARGELLALRPILGAFDFALICRVLGAGRDLAEAESSDHQRRYLAHRLRDALGMMAARFAHEPAF